MKNPKLMKRKELLAEIERLQTLLHTASEKNYLNELDARAFKVLRIRYRLMKVGLREKMKKQDSIFHKILTEQRVTKD